MAFLTEVNLAGNLIGAILAIHLVVAMALHLRKAFVKLVEKEAAIQMLLQERRSKVETHTVAFQRSIWARQRQSQIQIQQQKRRIIKTHGVAGGMCKTWSKALGTAEVCVVGGFLLKESFAVREHDHTR